MPCACAYIIPPALAFQVPVVFFSLLRKGTPDRDRSEAKLAEAFDYVSAGAAVVMLLSLGFSSHVNVNTWSALNT